MSPAGRSIDIQSRHGGTNSIITTGGLEMALIKDTFTPDTRVSAMSPDRMSEKAIQDYCPDEVAICYGCGRNNPEGLHLKTFWDGSEGVLRFRPKPYHSAFPGAVYGGLIASLIDCHGTGTAAAAAYEAEGRKPGTEPEITFVTGNLNVSFLKPTPIDTELVVRARPRELTERKAIIVCSVYANGEECARGEVVAVRVVSRNFLSGRDKPADTKKL